MNTIAPAGIMARLREETWPQHQKAEGRPLEQALANGGLSREGFVQYLAQRYPIHHALEAAMLKLRAARPELAPVIDESLFQEQNLLADCKHFGLDAKTIEPLVATRALVAQILTWAQQDPIGLLGAYYVLEGSKNGARFIARRMAATHQLRPDAGLRYLDPHGEQQRPMWQDFKAKMDACGFTPAEQDRIVTAAQHMFDGISAIDDELYARIAPK